GPGIDHEQEVALLDDLTVLEVDLRQVTAHPCPDLDIVDCGELPGELLPLNDFLLQRRAHGHRRWGRRGLRERRTDWAQDKRTHGKRQTGRTTGKPVCWRPPWASSVRASSTTADHRFLLLVRIKNVRPATNAPNRKAAAAMTVASFQCSRGGRTALATRLS